MNARTIGTAGAGVLALMLTLPSAAANIIEIVSFPTDHECGDTGKAYINYLAVEYKSCNNGRPDAYLTSQELDGYTGLPIFSQSPLFTYPTWPCIPQPVPGPFVINACDQNAAPKTTDCSQDCQAEPANRVGDPVDLTSGHLSYAATDVDLGQGLRFARYYASGRASDSGSELGRGWTHSLQWKLERGTLGALNLPLVTVTRPLHNPIVFVKKSQNEEIYLGSAQHRDGSLSVAQDGTATYTDPDGTVATFSAANELVSIKQVNEPTISVSHATSPEAATFSSGPRRIVVTKGSSGRVATVTAENPAAGWSRTWSYGYDTGFNLTTVSGPDPGSGSTLTWTYEYTGIGSIATGFLKKIKRTGLATDLASWSYDPQLPVRVRSADEPALDQPLTFEYAGSSPLETTVKAGGQQLAKVTTSKGIIEAVSNAAGPANPTPNAVSPVPGGAGVPVPFVSGTKDALSRWRTKTDKNGNVTLFDDYDPQGNPRRIVEGWQDNGNGAFDATGDAYTRRREYSYHPLLRTPLTIMEASAVTGAFPGKVTTFDYDDPADDPNPLAPNSKPTTRIYRESVAGYTVNAAGAAVPLPTTTVSYTYNGDGKVMTVTGPGSRYVEYTYSPEGYRTAEKRYLNGPNSAHLDTTFSAFDALGNPQTITDPSGRATAFTYDSLSRVRTVTPPYEGTGSTTTTFTYDVDGNLTRIDFPPDTFSQAAYLNLIHDPAKPSALRAIADSQGNAIVYDYAGGRVTEESRYTGFVDLVTRGTKVGDATFAYDTAARVVASFNPLFADNSVATQFGPDGNGNPASVIDENAKQTTLLFDALDRLKTISEIRGGTHYDTGFGYGADSNVTSVTDAAGKATDLLYDDQENLVETDSPDTGTTRFLYDAAGNLVRKIENATGTARSTYYAYDGLNRLTVIDLPNDPDWVFTYDTSDVKNQKGRLAQVTNGTVTTQLEYTHRGDVAVERTILGGLAYAVQYTYDAAGNRRVLSAPSGDQVSMFFSGLRPNLMSLFARNYSQGIGGITWYPFGPRTQASFPPLLNGAYSVQSMRHVNLRGQIDELTVTSGGTSILNRSYRYASTGGGAAPTDPGPNLDEVIDNRDGTESRFYFYDALDRLEKATTLGGTVLQQYGYDAVGNRTSEGSGASEVDYDYEGPFGSPINNRLDAASGAATRDYAHDAYGNRIYDGAAAFTGSPSLLYDDSNRLIEVRDPANGFATVALYTYDAFGRRVKKVAGGHTTLFFYDTAGHLLEEVDKTTNAVRTYVYLEDELVGLIDDVASVGSSALALPGGWRIELQPPLVFLLLSLGAGLAIVVVTRRWPVGIATTSTGFALLLLCAGTGRAPPRFEWIHTDPLGTPLAVTNTPASGNAVAIWRAKYEPFGKATVDENPDGDGATFSLNVRFPGQYADGESGYSYNGLRDYDPASGQYLEVEPRDVAAGGYSPYAYARSSPLRFIDRFGLCVEDLCIAEGLGLAAFAQAIVPTAITTSAIATALGIETLFSDSTDRPDGAASDAAPTCPAPDAAHSDEQKALNDLIHDLTNSGRDPLTSEDADAALDLAEKLGLRPRDDRATDHWSGGSHIHIPGSGISHIPAKRP